MQACCVHSRLPHPHLRIRRMFLTRWVHGLRLVMAAIWKPDSTYSMTRLGRFRSPARLPLQSVPIGPTSFSPTLTFCLYTEATRFGRGSWFPARKAKLRQGRYG